MQCQSAILQLTPPALAVGEREHLRTLDLVRHFLSSSWHPRVLLTPPGVVVVLRLARVLLRVVVVEGNRDEAPRRCRRWAPQIGSLPARRSAFAVARSTYCSDARGGARESARD